MAHKKNDSTQLGGEGGDNRDTPQLSSRRSEPYFTTLLAYDEGTVHIGIL